MAYRLFGANHFLNQCWLVVNWTLTNQNTMVFIEVNTFETVFCKLATIFSRLQSANRGVHGCRYVGFNWWRTDCWDHSKVPIMISITIGYSHSWHESTTSRHFAADQPKVCIDIWYAIHPQSPWKEAVPVSILLVHGETYRVLVLVLRIGALVCVARISAQSHSICVNLRQFSQMQSPQSSHSHSLNCFKVTLLSSGEFIYFQTLQVF